MRDTLAEKLLAKIMDWLPERIDDERPLLQAMANLKWNEYQQFAPGTRFIESLVKWLQQFETLEEKNTAYKIIKEHLIFISTEQMAHLVNILFSEKVNPILIKRTALEISVSKYLVKKIRNSQAYKNNFRSSLFMGLSDGSRIDQFRRVAGLSNEQVVSTYEVSPNKMGEMLRDLRKEVPDSKFRSIFLLDDFTASGKSYCRPEEDKGKLLKFFNEIFVNQKSLEYKNVLDLDNLEIHILIYIATTDAIKNIDEGILAWQKSNRVFKYSIDCLLEIGADTKYKVTNDNNIMALIKKYFDNKIVDDHYEKGKHNLPFLGFNECGLPLILNHNCPNNSLPILWMPEDKKYKGLFPRISRH
jgi:hypothetical protein